MVSMCLAHHRDILWGQDNSQVNDIDKWIINNPWKVCVIYPATIIATGMLVMFLSMSVIENLVFGLKSGICYP